MEIILPSLTVVQLALQKLEKFAEIASEFRAINIPRKITAIKANVFANVKMF